MKVSCYEDLLLMCGIKENIPGDVTCNNATCPSGNRFDWKGYVLLSFHYDLWVKTTKLR